MQRNECKPGTEVVIRGTVEGDDGTDYDPIEEIEAEAPYFVQEDYPFFDIYRKGNTDLWLASFCCTNHLFSKEEAKTAAETFCAELNRKHQESLNA